MTPSTPLHIYSPPHLTILIFIPPPPHTQINAFTHTFTYHPPTYHTSHHLTHHLIHTLTHPPHHSLPLRHPPPSPTLTHTHTHPHTPTPTHSHTLGGLSVGTHNTLDTPRLLTAPINLIFYNGASRAFIAAPIEPLTRAKDR